MTFTPARALLLATGAALGGIGLARALAPDAFGAPIAQGVLAWHLILAGSSFALGALPRHDSTARRTAVLFGLLEIGIGIVIGSSRPTVGLNVFDALTLVATGLALLVAALVSQPNEDRIERGRIAG